METTTRTVAGSIGGFVGKKFTSGNSTSDVSSRIVARGPLWSSYMDDPIVRQLLPQFAVTLQKRVLGLREAVVTGDAPEACKIAHMIRGAAGSYGYPSVADVAGRVEIRASSGRDLAASLSDVDELATLAAAIRVAIGSL
ncbi:Hpt domain-containing protein [bacterium]|nr:Hpt domain-containing protein [bacterium]